MKKLIAGLVMLTIVFTACTKESNQKNSFCGDGYIFWGGDPAIDGTGWYFSTKSNRNFEYPVLDLADSLKTDSLVLNACLEQTDQKYVLPNRDYVYYYRITSVTVK